MTASSTDTRQSMDSCPSLEDIAAFLDGTLSAEERERITEHLARCESCYEVFAGAVHFQVADSSAKDTGGRRVIPFPLADKISRWLPLAASVVLVAGLGFLTWRLLEPPTITLAGMVEPIEEKPGISDVLYGKDPTRGSGQTADVDWNRPAFLVGVHLIDLRLSVNAGKVDAAANHLQGLGVELKEIPFSGDLGERCLNEYATLKDAETLKLFAPKHPRLEKEIEQSLAGDPSFSFGLWTEAGRLSAAVKSPDFFKRRDNRRFLPLVQKDVPVAEEIQEPVLDDLRTVQSTWEKGDFSENDYRALATHFQSVIERIDEYEEAPPLPE